MGEDEERARRFSLPFPFPFFPEALTVPARSMLARPAAKVVDVDRAAASRPERRAPGVTGEGDVPRAKDT